MVIDDGWHSLSLELSEGWVCEFRGSQLDNWGFVLLDLNPGERTLPLGYDGLEALETWLQWIGAVKPEAAVGEERKVMVSINTVSNLKVDACETNARPIPQSALPSMISPMPWPSYHRSR